MNARRVNAAAGVIHASQMQGKRTAAGIAADLESACLLQSPESAAEMVRLRSRVDELEAVVTAERIRHTQYADSPHCQADGEFWPCPFVAAVDGLRRLVAQAAPSSAEVDRCHEALEFDHECRVCRPPVEDPHDGPLAHWYRVGRDLPGTGGAR